MRIKLVIKKSFLILSLMIIWGCVEKNNNSKEGKVVCTLNLDFREKFDETDVFDARSVINLSDVYGDLLKVKINTKYEIVKAEWITYLYPTIWAGFDDDVMQFIYLFNIEHKEVLQPLRIVDNIIEFPPCIGEGKDAESRNFFKGITKVQLLNALNKVPEEYVNKGEGTSYAYKSWEMEEKVWQRIVKTYTPGDLINLPNEPFDVGPHKTDLVVTFKGTQGEFKKVFRSKFVVGN